jgi:hypothetical protein
MRRRVQLPAVNDYVIVSCSSSFADEKGIQSLGYQQQNTCSCGVRQQQQNLTGAARWGR